MSCQGVAGRSFWPALDNSQPASFGHTSGAALLDRSPSLCRRSRTCSQSNRRYLPSRYTPSSAEWEYTQLRGTRNRVAISSTVRRSCVCWVLPSCGLSLSTCTCTLFVELTNFNRLQTHLPTLVFTATSEAQVNFLSLFQQDPHR